MSDDSLEFSEIKTDDSEFISSDQVDVGINSSDNSVTEITMTDDILITIHQAISKQTEYIEAIQVKQYEFMSFFYVFVVIFIIYLFSKFLDKILFRFI